MSEASAQVSSHRHQRLAGLGLTVVYGIVGGFVLTQESLPWAIILWSLLLGPTLIALSIIDLATLRLPNVGTLGLALLGLIATAQVSPGALKEHATAGLAGFSFLLIVNTLYRWLRGRDGIGGGDAKLLAAAGTWTGPLGIFAVLLWATLTALLAFTALALAGREVSRQSALPFGPFLALAIWITWCFGPLQAVP